MSVNGEAWLSFHCSPDDLEALAVGFLYNEAFIQSADEVASLHICDARDHIDVWLTHAANKPEQWSRTSGCQGGLVQPFGSWMAGHRDFAVDESALIGGDGGGADVAPGPGGVR